MAYDRALTTEATRKAAIIIADALKQLEPPTGCKVADISLRRDCVALIGGASLQYLATPVIELAEPFDNVWIGS